MGTLILSDLIYYTHKNIPFLTKTINAKLINENMQISLTFSPESKISETSSFIHSYRKQYFAPVWCFRGPKNTTRRIENLLHTNGFLNRFSHILTLTFFFHFMHFFKNRLYFFLLSIMRFVNVEISHLFVFKVFTKSSYKEGSDNGLRQTETSANKFKKMLRLCMTV